MSPQELEREIRPEEKAALHEKRAKEHYLRGDYPATVKELGLCLETERVPEPKNLRMMLLILQTHRRFADLESAGSMLRRMESKYGGSNDKFIRNIILNEREITEGAVELRSYPTRLTVRPTSRCSVRCNMCTFWKEPPWDMPQRTLDEVVALYPYLEDILWQGGEVFEMMREVFTDILLRGIDYPHLLQNIITNGLAIDKEWAENLVRTNIHIKFSIDGTTPEVYERIRVRAKFADLLRSVDNLNDAMAKHGKRIGFSLHMVVQRHNYLQIEQMQEFAKEHRFDAVALSPVEGDLYRAIDIFNHGDRQIWDAIERQRAAVRKKALAYGIYLEDNLPFPPAAEEPAPPRDPAQPEKRYPLSPMTMAESAEYASSRFSSFCLSPWKNMILRNGGGVLPNWHCGETYVGNVEERPLLEIWNGEPMRNFRRAIRDRKFGGVCRAYCLSGALMESWKHHMEWYWS